MPVQEAQSTIFFNSACRRVSFAMALLLSGVCSLGSAC
jgi:hypothetical protein